MPNSFFNHTDPFTAGSTVRSDSANAKFDGVETGMDAVEVESDRSVKLPIGVTGEVTENAGARANQVLGFDNSGNFQIQQGAGTYKGDWATATIYKERDIIKDAAGTLGLNNLYVSNAYHVSTNLTSDSANWDLMLDVTEVNAAKIAAQLAETNAAISETNAAISESNSASSEAATAADLVLTDLDTVATAADVVTTDANVVSCASSESNSATSASNASTSETNSATSASNASTSETNSAASAASAAADLVLTNADVVSAEAAKTAAELAYDNFDDRYLGDKISDPVLDNDGGALLDGAMYWNTTTNNLKVYDLGGTTWVSLGNYTHPDHTGDVTSTGDGATVITNNAVTLSKMADMATASLLGRNTAGSGDPEVLSATTAKSLLAIAASDVTNSPSGGVSASDVQAAINELDSEKLANSDIGSTVQAYDADTTKNDLANVFTQNQQISLGQPSLILNESDQGVDLKQWRARITGGILKLTTYSDANAVIANPLELTRSGDLTALGNVTAYSDERLKANIQPIQAALWKVQQLSGYTFDRIDSDLSRQTGVIAQEVLAVLPEAVIEQEDGMYSVAYGNMMGLMIEAIKELTLKVEALEAK